MKNWLIIDRKYRIMTKKDVKQSGIYYNERLKRYEVYYLEGAGVGKLIFFIRSSDLWESQDQEKLFQESFGKLKQFYREINLKFNIPQMGDFA